MNKRTKIRNLMIVLVMLILCGLLFLFLSPNRKPNETRIGVIVPLTGAAADFGKWAQNGTELAIEELNNGEAHEIHFKAVYEDNQMNPAVSLSAFRKLTNVDEVVGVITSGSGVVLAIAPVAEQKHIVQINHAAVSPAIRNAGEYTFTLVNDANVETDEIAQLLHDKLAIKKLAILYANTAYGVGTKDALVKSFDGVGGNVMASIAFSEDFTDIRTQLIQLKEMNPPAIYFIATIKDSARLLKQARELGIKTQWLSFNAFESPEILKIAGEAAEGVIYTSSNLFDLPNPQPKSKQFFDSYCAKYGERPNLYAATAYDAMHILALACSSAEDTGKSIRDTIASLSNYQGASGVITFDEDGCVRKAVFLKTVKNGKFDIYSYEGGEE